MARCDIIRDEAGFGALRAEWTALLARSASDQPFLTWEWLHAWWTHLRGDRALHLVTVRDGDGTLIGLAPLARRPARHRRLQPHPVLEFLGSGVAGSDYLDFIVDRDREAEVLEALAAHCMDAGAVLELSRTRPSSSCARALSRHLERTGWAAQVERNEVCPYIATEGHDWDSYLETVGSAHRYNVRRRFRKLEKAFDVEYERCVDEEGRTRCLDELVRLHLLRRDTLGGSDALDDPALVEFHRTFTAHALGRGWLRLYVLKLDGRAAAAVYGLFHGDTFYFYQSGFDPAYNKYSVGLVALGHSIREAIAEGAREYDLLHGDEGYKYRWASGQRELCRITLYPPGAFGRVARGLARLKSRIKAIRDDRQEGRWHAA